MKKELLTVVKKAINRRLMASMLVIAALTFTITVPGLAGAVRGASCGTYRLPARGSHTFRISFYGGETARVALSGDGDTDLDLYVYDPFGNLMDSDDDSSDDCIAEWFPGRTRTFIIRVVNRGSVYNEYRMCTN